MQVRSGNLTPLVARGIALLCAIVLVTCAASTVLAAGVVGTGSAASCTDAALDAALAGGGLVTFNCGGPATIDVSTEREIDTDTTIDGGSLITISGANVGTVFLVNYFATFTVQNLTIANGGFMQGATGMADGPHPRGVGSFPSGGGIFNYGTLTVTNCTVSGNSSASGGGIANHGTLTVTNSTFSDNSARNQTGGAIFNAPRHADGHQQHILRQ